MDALTNAQEILTQTKQLLRLSNNDQDIWLSSLISQRARDLNSADTLIIKNCEITVTNNKFYLPKDCKKMLAFRDKGSCIQGIFIDVDFFNNCNCNFPNVPTLRSIISINGRWANFINIVEDGTIVEISYQAVNEDINEEAYTSIANYVAWQFANAYVELYTPEQRAMWRQDGVYGGGRVRSAAARRRFEQDRIQIVNVMTRVVNAQAPFANMSGSFSFWTQTYNSFTAPI